MQGFGAVEHELWWLGGDELLDDARTEAQTYAALYFPWNGDGDEPPQRQTARRDVLTARLDRARAHTEPTATHTDADPNAPGPAPPTR